MKTTLIFLLSLIITAAAAQDTLHKVVQSDSVRQKVAYYGYLQTGALVACNSCQGGQQITFTSAIVQGISLGKRMRVGAGAGFDSYYGWQVVPIFGSFEFDLIHVNPKQAVIFQFQYGGASARLNNEFKSYGYSKIEAGKMVYPQLGYRIQYHDLKLGFIIGYKYQRLEASYEYPIYQPDVIGTKMVVDYNRTVLEQRISRFAVAIQIGWK